jgi:serine/threonine protein kinase
MTEDELGYDLQGLFSADPAGPETEATRNDSVDASADGFRDDGLHAQPAAEGAYDPLKPNGETGGGEPRDASVLPVPPVTGSIGTGGVEQLITGSLDDERERAQSTHQQVAPLMNSTHPYQPRPGDLIDRRYKVVDLLGCGSYAEVYKCLDVHLEQQFAVKVMSLVSATDDVLREARIAAKLQHPSILRVVNIGRLKETGSWYIVMDYKEGSRTLETVLDEAENRLRRLPLNEHTLQIVSEVADALAHAHALDVTHQDVKPSNIIIDQEGHAYLTDFGLARVKKPSGGSMKTIDAQNGLSGTIPYMAPEQFEDQESSEPLGPTVDVYSLAVITYEILVGQLPYPGRATGPIIRQIVEGVRTPPRQLNAEIPREVENVLLRSLRPDPKDRYCSPTEFVNALLEAAQAYIADEELYAEATSLFDRGNWRDALDRFEHIEELMPAYKETRLFLERARRQVQLLDLYEKAQELFEQGAYEACLDKLTVLTQLAPKYDVDAVREQARRALEEKWYRRATELYEAGDYQNCLRVIEEIKHRAPGFVDKEGIADRARQVVQRRQYLLHLYDLSVEQTQTEDWASALQTLEELYREAPQYADVEARLTMIRYIARLSGMYETAQELLQAGEYADCIGQLDELTHMNDEYKADHVAKLRNQAADSLYRRAAQFLEGGQFERALADLDSLEAHTDLADSHQIRIRAEEGLAARKLRAELDGMYDRAAEHLDLRQYTACLDLLTEIYSIDPGYPDHRYLKRQAREGKCSLLYTEALGALVKRRYLEAEALWGQIRDLDPAYPDPQDIEGQLLKGLRWRRWLRIFQTTRNGRSSSSDDHSAASPPSTGSSLAPVSVPLSEAVAKEPALLFERPVVGAREICVVEEGTSVQVTGRVEDLENGRWLRVQMDENVDGFVREPRFEYTLDWSSLPKVEIGDLSPPPSGGGLAIPPGNLEIVRISPSAVCGENGWTALFEVKIAGGDGRSYTIYWDQEPVEFTVRDVEPDVAVIELLGTEEGVIEGTVRVESGGQWSALHTSLQAPEYPRS